MKRYKYLSEKTLKNLKEFRINSKEFIKAISQKSLILLSEKVLTKIPENIQDIPKLIKTLPKFVLFTPLGLFGFKLGKFFPDLDIKLLGIGAHRYFFFHSAISIFLLKKIYEAYLAKNGKLKKPDSLAKKILGVVLSCGSFAVGIHLLSDAVNPKSVVFPFVGSLINGTLIDDNIFLLGNALWCFVIGKNTLVFAIGDDIEVVKKYVYSKFKNFIESKITIKSYT